MGKTTLMLIMSIICFGFFLRVYDLNHQSYWIDEGYTVNIISSIMRGDGLVLKSGVISHDIVYGYLGALSSSFFGSFPWTYRLPAVFFGIFFIVIIFMCARDFFDRRVALLSSFFISLSYWQIAWSRQAREYTALAFFFWLSLWSFHRFLCHRRSLWYGFLTLVFFLCALLTHRLAYILPLIFLVWALVELSPHNVFSHFSLRSIRQAKKSLENLLGSNPIIYCGRIFLCYHQVFLIVGGAFALIIFCDYWLGFGFLSVAINALRVGYYFPYYLRFIFHEYWFFIILFFAGLLFVPRVRHKPLILVSVPFVISFGVFSFLFGEDLINYRYLFFVTPTLYILGSVGIFSLYDRMKAFWNAFFFVSVIVLFFIIGAGVLIPRSLYWLESDDVTAPAPWWREYYSYTPQPNFFEAYAFVREHRKNNEPVISTHAVFNDLYVGERGYWLKSSLNYFDTSGGDYLKVSGDRDFYVGARVIDNLYELRDVLRQGGFVIFDYLSLHNKSGVDMLEYVMKHGRFVYYHEYNSVSKIWVYAFDS